MDDVKNFMRIFTGYNINNSMPSKNPLKDIIYKKLNREKSETFTREDRKLERRNEKISSSF